jgi:hypothetical protein
LNLGKGLKPKNIPDDTRITGTLISQSLIAKLSSQTGSEARIAYNQPSELGYDLPHGRPQVPHTSPKGHEFREILHEFFPKVMEYFSKIVPS